MIAPWKCYYPENGETADDARELHPPSWAGIFFNAEDAAVAACGLDYDSRDGWERGMESRFEIVIIAPDTGEESRWWGWSEAQVNHQVEEKET